MKWGEGLLRVRGGQNWLMGGTACGRNMLNTYMKAYSETIALYDELYAKLHTQLQMAPLWATSTDFSGQPKGFQGSQQSTWLPTCLKSHPSVSVQLLSNDWPSRVCSCSTYSILDPETKLSYFLQPHDLVSVIMPCLLI